MSVAAASLETDHHVLLSDVASGRGVALLPKSFTCLRRAGVVYRSLVEGDELAVGIGLVNAQGPERNARRTDRNGSVAVNVDPCAECRAHDVQQPCLGNRIGIEHPPMATPNCSTYGHSNCSRQDGRIMTIRT